VDFVSISVDAAVATILIDRPPINALSTPVQRELLAAARQVSERRDVRDVVLYGGPKRFVGGADIKEMATASYTDMVEVSVGLHVAFNALADIPKPVVAAISGYALGGGLELALTADFRVCGDNSRLGQPEILLGIIPGAGGTQRLPRLIGVARAKDLIYTGRIVEADEALRLGLVDEVVPPDDVYDAAMAKARQFADGPAFALRAAKAAIDRGLSTDLAAGLEYERVLFASLFATGDREIGMRSFIENGPGQARFEGA
jgi:enoyl-CoA hydratase/carnithine racemase